VPEETWIENDDLVLRLTALPADKKKEWAPNRRAPSRGMLEQFVMLEGRSELDIARYARKWGPLGIRPIRDPKKDRSEWMTIGKAVRSDLLPDSLEAEDMEFMKYGENICPIIPEPLTYWRYWINGFAAALRVAAAIRLHQFPAVHDWNDAINAPEQILPVEKYLPREEFDKSVSETDAGVRMAAMTMYHLTEDETFLESDEQLKEREKHMSSADLRFAEANRGRIALEAIRIHFFGILNQWREIADLHLWLSAEEDRIEIATDCLFAGLTWQLLSCACASGALCICSECGATYSPKRQPRLSTKNYCPKCGRRAAVRNAVRAHRLRQSRENGSVYPEGKR
jgi:hypothetical protein